MSRKNSTTWNILQSRFALAGRVLLALIGGAIFAYVAWEPATQPADQDARPKSKAEIDQSMQMPTVAWKSNETRPPRIDAASSDAVQRTRSKQWAEPQDQVNPEGDTTRTANASSQSTFDDGNGTVNAQSRSPPD